MADPFLRPGYYQLEEIIITSQSGASYLLTNIASSSIDMDISLLAPFITGTLTVEDGLGMHNIIPFVGEEKIYMSFLSDNRERKEFEGRIYRMSDMSIDDKYSSSTYILHFISEAGFQNLVKPTIDYHTNALPFTAVRNICSVLNPDKSLITHGQCNTPLNLVFPKVTPSRAIQMVAKNTYDASSDRASVYLFYETLDDFYFSNVEYLMDEDPVGGNEYYFHYSEEYQSAPGQGEFRKREHYRILSSEEYPRFDLYDRLNGGMIESELVRLDLVTKNVLSQKTYYNDVSKNFNTPKTDNKKKKFINVHTDDFINEYKTPIDKQLANFLNTDYNVLNNSGTFSDKALSYAKSYGLFHALVQSSMKIQTSGNTDRKPGDIILISEYPRGSASRKNRSNVDHYRSGSYIVIGVKHIFNQGKMTTILNLSKPYFDKEIESKALEGGLPDEF